MCALPVAGFVGLVRAVEAGAAFCGFLAGEAAEAIVLGFCVGGGMVERCEELMRMLREGIGECEMLLWLWANWGVDVQREPKEYISIAAMISRH